jgi:hypothetical protein
LKLEGLNLPAETIRAEDILDHYTQKRLKAEPNSLSDALKSIDERSKAVS